MGKETATEEQKPTEAKRMFFAEAKMFSDKYHIFKEGKNFSLCGKWVLPSDLKEDDKSYVDGDEKFKKGSDCKTCFKQAGLKIPEEVKENA